MNSETGDFYVIGETAATLAEYGAGSDLPITLVSLYDGEVACWEGYETIEAAKASLVDVPRESYVFL